MIEAILPAEVATAETRADTPGVVLTPEEEQAVGQSVEQRRREFATGRHCARSALRQLGLTPGTLPSGPHGEPRWPADVVGSITHCDGYRAAAVAHSSDLLTVAIDAEPNQPLPERLVADIARPEERPALAALGRDQPEIHWDRLLFSAKESVYKAWFPLARRWLGFEDAVVTLDPGRRTFSARLLVPGPSVAGGELTRFSGWWMAAEGLLLTAIAITTGGPR